MDDTGTGGKRSVTNVMRISKSSKLCMLLDAVISGESNRPIRGGASFEHGEGGCHIEYISLNSLCKSN